MSSLVVSSSPEPAMSANQRILNLVATHSEKKGKKVNITHPDFSALPKESRQTIELILRETYKKDFEILRKAFDEKLELYLRTASDILSEAGCEDHELRAEIVFIRQQITDTLQTQVISKEDILWLNKIGFSRADVIDLSTHHNTLEVIADLKQYADIYHVILGDKKYIKKILKMSDGFRKLKAIRTFNSAIRFNGYHLSQIVVGADWEEKLHYFKDPQKLKTLTDAGFNGYHLSQIVANKGWEEKLRYFEDPAKLRTLTDAGFNGYHLSQIVRGAGWEEKLRYFEDSAKLKTLTDAGFEASHLSQIVVNKGWEEKLRYFEDPAKLKTLTDAGFEASHLSQIVVNKGWEEKLRIVLSSEALRQALREGHLTHDKLAKMLRKKNWRQLVSEV